MMGRLICSSLLVLVLVVSSAMAQGVGFIENCGQWPSDVLAYAPNAGVRAVAEGFEFARGDVSAVRWRRGVSSHVVVSEPMPGAANWLVGDRERWLRGLTHYGAAVVEGPGRVALCLRLRESGPELQLNAESWAAIQACRFDLEARTTAESSRAVPIALVVEAESRDAWLRWGDGGFRVSFDEAGEASWVTVLGGSGADTPRRVAVGGNGETFVGGETISADFPLSENAFDQVFDEHVQQVWEGVVLCYGPGGDLTFATYLGGSEGGEGIDDLASHPDGGVVVFGRTGSDDFPITPGVLDDVIEHFYTKNFACHLNAQGTDLVWSTFLLEVDGFAGGVVHDDGEVTVAGRTFDPDFPTTPGVLKSDVAPEGFVAAGYVFRMNADATGLVYSTLFGGSTADAITDVDADEFGNVALLGETLSPDFPLTPGAVDSTPGSSSTTFVALMSGYGTQLEWASYFEYPGTGPIRDIALDRAGRVYVTGFSIEPEIPITPGAFDTSPLALYKGYVTCFADATQLAYSTYFGGSWWCEIWDIVVDASGVASITGMTKSLDHPVSPGAFNTSKFAEDPDVFLARLAPDGRSLLYGTFLDGTTTSTESVALDVSSDGIVSVAFYALGGDIITTDGSTVTGVSDIVVARLDPIPTGVTRLGLPTSGDHDPLVIGVREMPAVGTSGFGLTCSQAPPLSSRGWLLLGGGQLASPVDVLSAELWIAPSAALAIVPVSSDEVGWVDVRMPLPDDPALVGQIATAQFAWLDHTAPGGLAASTGLALTIQP